ncbi:hypothetical protein AMECASPLE_036310 [Ameca splendens]|uniref:Uncharacterized protein n=1 Tax=Ameca splendens TaxID=208324 RepID=A0ABV0ZHF4_9TELE
MLSQSLHCSKKLNAFLHSHIETRHMIFKVRISMQNSALDINDPKVQDSILEQMKLRMSETATGGMHLRWKKQSNLIVLFGCVYSFLLISPDVFYCLWRLFFHFSVCFSFLCAVLWFSGCFKFDFRNASLH